MRWLAGLTVAAVLLSGCAPQAAKPDNPVVEPGPIDSAKETVLEAHPLPVQSVSAVLRRVTFPNSTAVVDQGHFSLDVKTGQVEAWEWINPTDDAKRFRFTGAFAPDGDWVWTSQGNTVYWVERKTGKTFTYDSSQIWAFAEGADRRLLAGQGSRVGEFWVTDQAFNLVRAFDWSFKGTQESKLGDGGLSGALFAPDGTRVAIGYRRVVSGAPSDLEVALVDLTSGEKRILAGRPDLKGWTPLAVRPVGNSVTGDLLVSYDLQAIEPTGLTRQRSVLLRYDWDGNLHEQFELPGHLINLSPDGRLMAVQQNLGFLTSAAVIMDVATGQPIFRVTWSSPGEWLADSSGLLLQNEDEVMIVSVRGELRRAPAMPASRYPIFGRSLRPSPVDPNQFAAGLAVIDQTGKVLTEIDLPNGKDLVIWGSRWSMDGSELRFEISWPTGKGNLGGGGWRLPSRVELPPFESDSFLQVKGPDGGSINLVATPSENGEVIGSATVGAKLSIGDLFQAPVKLNTPVLVDDSGETWLWVRTSDGKTGFINVTRDSVKWAD